HNCKFELGWLRRVGFTKAILLYDTYLAEYCIAGNRRWPLDLDSVAEKYTGKKKHGAVHESIQSGICPTTIDPEALSLYCRNDVEITHELFLKQLGIADELGLLPSIYTRCLLTPVLCSLEQRGMALDRQVVRHTYTSYNEKLRSLRAALSEETGGVNLNSPKQLGIYLYETLGF